MAFRPALQYDELANARIYEEKRLSVVLLWLDASTSNVPEVRRRIGAGCVWDKDGHIVTNYHVICGASDINVTFADEETYKAMVVGFDRDKDVAVLHVDALEDNLIPIPLGVSEGLYVGQRVCAIGHPFGLPFSLSTGVISDPGRKIGSVVSGCPIQDVIQMSCAINPENSGGPLLDSSGRLIGINTAIFSPSGGSCGVGFSIPVDTVRSIVDQMLKPGKADAKLCTTTGLSANDLPKTISSLAPLDSRLEDSNRSAHISPLKYKDEDVPKRVGHLEASVDPAMLVGLDSVTVPCKTVDELQELVMKMNLNSISFDDLIRYGWEKETSVERWSTEPMDTKKWGLFQAYYYRSQLDGAEHIAMVKGDISDGQGILVSLHSGCLAGDLLRSVKCDCRKQLELSMQQIEEAGRGVLVYLSGHKEKGIGQVHKFNAFNKWVLCIDSKEHGISAQILSDLGVQTMKMMTHNFDDPAKASLIISSGSMGDS